MVTLYENRTKSLGKHEISSKGGELFIQHLLYDLMKAEWIISYAMHHSESLMQVICICSRK